MQQFVLWAATQLLHVASVLFCVRTFPGRLSKRWNDWPLSVLRPPRAPNRRANKGGSSRLRIETWMSGWKARETPELSDRFVSTSTSGRMTGPGAFCETQAFCTSTPQHIFRREPTAYLSGRTSNFFR